jgi:hypothetical protein
MYKLINLMHLAKMKKMELSILNIVVFVYCFNKTQIWEILCPVAHIAKTRYKSNENRSVPWNGTVASLAKGREWTVSE